MTLTFFISNTHSEQESLFLSVSHSSSSRYVFTHYSFVFVSYFILWMFFTVSKSSLHLVPLFLCIFGLSSSFPLILFLPMLHPNPSLCNVLSTHPPASLFLFQFISICHALLVSETNAEFLKQICVFFHVSPRCVSLCLCPGVWQSVSNARVRGISWQSLRWWPIPSQVGLNGD